MTFKINVGEFHKEGSFYCYIQVMCKSVSPEREKLAAFRNNLLS